MFQFFLSQSRFKLITVGSLLSVKLRFSEGEGGGRGCTALTPAVNKFQALLKKCKVLIKSDGQQISSIEWQELKNRFLSFCR